jgi:hypothetical protein
MPSGFNSRFKISITSTDAQYFNSTGDNWFADDGSGGPGGMKLTFEGEKLKISGTSSWTHGFDGLYTKQ